MKALSKLVLVFSFTMGCAGTQVARPTQHATALRGTVVLDGPAVKAVMVGPSTIHAYSAYEGGSIFTAPAVSGTDSDCRLAAGQAARVSLLPRDRITAFEVGAGRVACLASARDGSLELLWHASREPARSTLVAATLAAE
jgi:hypothetical protein